MRSLLLISAVILFLIACGIGTFDETPDLAVLGAVTSGGLAAFAGSFAVRD